MIMLILLKLRGLDYCYRLYLVGFNGASHYHVVVSYFDVTPQQFLKIFISLNDGGHKVGGCVYCNPSATLLFHDIIIIYFEVFFRNIMTRVVGIYFCCDDDIHVVQFNSSC